MKTKTRNYILTLAGILILGVLSVMATTIRDDYSTFNNTKINESGLFYSNQKASVRTADVVVCRGTSVLDDLYKSFTCDVVCLSTDSDCGIILNTTINNAIKNRKWNIYIKNGIYNISNQIFIDLTNYSLHGNTLTIDGGNSLIYANVFSSEVDAVIKIDGNSDNNYKDNPIIIRNLRIDVNGKNQPVVSPYVFAGIRINSIYNSLIDSVTIKNAVWSGIAVYEFSGSLPHDRTLGGRIINSNFENIGLNVGGIPPEVCCYGGVYVSNYVKGFNIAHSNFRNSFQGVAIEDESDAIISSSYFVNNSAGVSIQNAYFNSIVSNDFDSNIQGVRVGGDSRFTSITGGNKFYDGVIGINGSAHECNYDGNQFYNLGDSGIISYGSDYGSSYSNNIFTNTNSNYSIYGRNASITLIDSVDVNLVNNIFQRDGQLSTYNANMKNIQTKGSLIDRVSIISSGQTYDRNEIENESNVYVEQHKYSGSIISNPCTDYNQFNERTIHNSTTQCTCTGGSWKCLTFE